MTLLASLLNDTMKPDSNLVWDPPYSSHPTLLHLFVVVQPRTRLLHNALAEAHQL